MKANDIIRNLRFVHSGLCLGLMAFTLVSYFEHYSFFAETDSGDPFVYLVPILAMTGYFTSKYIFQQQLKAIARDDALSSKLKKYQTANMLQYALVEGPALFALVIYYMQGNAFFLVIGLSLLAYLISLRPKTDKLIKALPLRQDEVKQIKTDP